MQSRLVGILRHRSEPQARARGFVIPARRDRLRSRLGKAVPKRAQWLSLVTAVESVEGRHTGGIKWECRVPDVVARLMLGGRLDSVSPGEPVANEKDLKSFLDAGTIT